MNFSTGKWNEVVVVMKSDKDKYQYTGVNLWIVYLFIIYILNYPFDILSPHMELMMLYPIRIGETI